MSLETFFIMLKKKGYRHKKSQEFFLKEEHMSGHKVTIFKPYPFQVGQKIRIEGSAREGDWEVIGINGQKFTLRCPVSGKEFRWNMFCYSVEEKDNFPWPMEK